MMQMPSLEEQLDLAINHVPSITLWRHPYFIGVLSFLSLALIVAAFFGYRWFTNKKKQKTGPQQLLLVLLQSLEAMKKGDVTPAEMMATLMIVLKSYTSWLTQNEIILAMTDSQWFIFIEGFEIFKPHLKAIADIMHMAQEIKFNQQPIGVSQVAKFVRETITIIDETLPPDYKKK